MATHKGNVYEYLISYLPFSSWLPFSFSQRNIKNVVEKVWFNMVLVKVGALKSATFMITLENENNLQWMLIS